MHDLVPFAITMLLVALALLAAIGSNRLAGLVRVPAPALFLVLAALAAYLVPRAGDLSVVADQRIVTIALVLILFDGGMHIGWARMRPSAGAVAWLGVAGTAVTAGALALLAHLLFGFDWREALLLGAALAPTDPAVVFSVFGGREIEGRSGTLLEGESGANDPVGIALMVSLLAAAGGGWHALAGGLGEFALQLSVGAAVGVAGGLLLRLLILRLPLSDEGLRPLRTLAVVLVLYGGATALGGSGFLAVFLAGIVVGDLETPDRRQGRHFFGVLASLAEIVAFVVLGLSIDLGSVFSDNRVWVGLRARRAAHRPGAPGAGRPVLAPIRLTRGERAFVLFAGLKGAVPILLGTYVLAEHVHGGQRIYDVVFVVVLVSVVVQGGLVPTVARLARVPMRDPDPQLPGEPSG